MSMKVTMCHMKRENASLPDKLSGVSENGSIVSFANQRRVFVWQRMVRMYYF
jgi:hypothetical protein